MVTILKDLENKSLSWFPTYQTIGFYEDKIRGWRDQDDSRLKKFSIKDFKDKSVLDIGCNIGALLHFALSKGASKVIGVDCMPDTILQAEEITAKYNQPIKYSVANILDDDFIKSIRKGFGVNHYDTVLFLSVYHSIDPKRIFIPIEEIKNVWKALNELTKHTLYFEGHSGEKEEEYTNLFNNYLDPEFRIEFLGMNHDYLNENYKPRPFFRCTRRGVKT